MDELDGWLRRLESIPSARPEKVVFRPRSSTGESRSKGSSNSIVHRTARSGSGSAFITGLTSPTDSTSSFKSIPEETGDGGDSNSKKEPSTRPGSALGSAVAAAAVRQIHLTSSSPLGRARSKSLSDTPAPNPSSSSSAQGEAGTVVSQSPLSLLPVTSVPPIINPLSSQSHSDATKSKTHRLSQIPVGLTAKSIKRRSVPSPLPLQVSLTSPVYANRRGSEKSFIQPEGDPDSNGERVGAKEEKGDIVSSETEGEEEEEGYRTVQESPFIEEAPKFPDSFNSQTPGEEIGEREETGEEESYSDLDGTPTIQAETPSPPRQRKLRRRRMASPASARFDPSETASSAQSIRSAASGGNMSSTGTGSRSSLKLQPRSPFASPHSSDWPRRRFGQSEDSSVEMEDNLTKEYSQKKDEYVTAAEAIRDMVRQPSHDSLGSIGKQKQREEEEMTASASRQSMESRVSSTQSHRPWVRVNKTSNGGASSVTNASPSSIGPRRPKLEARDDRIPKRERPLRPRFNSSRSASSLPLDEELNGNRSQSPIFAKKLSWQDDEDDLDYDDDSVSQDRRRASVSSASQLYSSAEGARIAAASRSSSSASTRRTNLAVPTPPFARSQSYDHVERHAEHLLRSSSSSTVTVDQSLQEYRHPCWLWISASQAALLDPSSSTKNAYSSSSSSHSKSFSKVLLGNVPGKKKVQKRDSTQFSALVGSPSVPTFSSSMSGSIGDISISREKDGKGKGKEKSSSKSTSTYQEGWKKCEVRLQANGLLSFYVAETGVSNTDSYTSGYVY